MRAILVAFGLLFVILAAAALPIASAKEPIVCVGIGSGGPLDCYAAVYGGCKSGANAQLSLQSHGNELYCLRGGNVD